MSDIKAMILACLIYFGVPAAIVVVALPWIVNLFNGFGYWHNAITLFCEATGLEKRLERHRSEKWTAKRKKWEAEREWTESN